MLQRLPSSGGGLNGKFNNSRQSRQPARRRRRRRRRGRNRPALSRLAPRARAGRRPALRQRRLGQRRSRLDRPQLHPRKHDRADRGAAGRRLGDLRLGRDRRRGQHHHQAAARTGFVASAQLGDYLDEGDGFTQNYQLSWGNGGDGPLAGRRRRQLREAGRRSAPATARSRASRRRIPTACADGGCSGYPAERPLTSSCDPRLATLTADRAGRFRRPTDARPTSGPFASLGRPFNFAPFNFSRFRSSATACSATAPRELTDNVNFSVKGIWNRRKSKNQAAPLPLGVGSAAGIRQSLDTITIDATNPFNPFGVDARLERNLRLHPPPLRRGRAAPLRPEGQHLLRRRRRSTASSTFLDGDWYLGRQRRYGARTRPSRRCSATSTPRNLRTGARPGRRLHRAPLRAVQHLRRRRVDHAGDDRLRRLHPARQQRADDLWDFTGNSRGNLFELPGGPLGLAIGVEYRELKGRFDPDPVVAAGFGSDIPAQPTRGELQRQGSLCGAQCSAAARRAVRRPARAEWRGALCPIIRPQARPRPSRPA